MGIPARPCSLRGTRTRSPGAVRDRASPREAAQLRPGPRQPGPIWVSVLSSTFPTAAIAESGDLVPAL